MLPVLCQVLALSKEHKQRFLENKAHSVQRVLIERFKGEAAVGHTSDYCQVIIPGYAGKLNIFKDVYIHRVVFPSLQGALEPERPSDDGPGRCSGRSSHHVFDDQSA